MAVQGERKKAVRMGGSEEEEPSHAVRNALIAGGSCGCLMMPLVAAGAAVVIVIFGGFGVLLAPIIALILLFTGGGGGGDDVGSYEDKGQEAIDIFEGDGKGALDAGTVPDDLLEHIEEAGELCGAIGPIVIASQLEAESGFNAAMVGPKGEEGIAQLPPEIFEKHGKDDDDNGKTSAFDKADSIMAQGRYMCELAGEAEQLINSKQAEGTVLDLTLAAYEVGMDAVRAARGVPTSQEVQGYIARIRAQFSKYSGLAPPPSGATPGVTPTETAP
ncbi:transglycosylase SLT domain-containing protein [Streptomyces sp. NPDC048290]|uniref:transglycosylase SLT domain-containing protein n=1 Tax=Streptomyces sp. NPDC048290 TaxID=3155811 RepID=UPI003413B006